MYLCICVSILLLVSVDYSNFCVYASTVVFYCAVMCLCRTAHYKKTYTTYVLTTGFAVDYPREASTACSARPLLAVRRLLGRGFLSVLVGGWAQGRDCDGDDEDLKHGRVRMNGGVVVSGKGVALALGIGIEMGIGIGLVLPGIYQYCKGLLQLSARELLLCC